MQPSAELRDLYVRLCEAQTSGDHAFFARRFSSKDGVVAIGTDPAEWWQGFETISEVFKAQLSEAGGFEMLPGEPLAFADGNVGWAAGRPLVRLPDGAEIPLRFTAVFQKGPDGWQIVQWHMSAGVSNEDLIGRSLTT